VDKVLKELKVETGLLGLRELKVPQVERVV
jgi:hypothetical protein